MSTSAAANVVTAGEFRLVDEHGSLRAKLCMEGGEPALGLGDSAGTVRANVRLNEDGEPALGLYDAKGQLRAGLGVGAKQGAMFWLCDPDGNVRLRISLAGEESALALNDTQGNTQAGLIVRQGSPIFWLCDGEGNVLFSAP